MIARILIPCALLVTGAASPRAGLDEEPVIRTNRTLEIRGALLKYTAEAGRIAIRDVETGDPHGYMFYTAYRVTSPGERRPLTFIWNGGPGAPSTLLHFSVAGPKLVVGVRLVNNVDTWLAVSDLVFVDPIGTGFSRPAKASYDSEFYGTVGDTASVTEFIRAWCLLHGAENVPLFLVGESWGAGRAASVAYALEKRGLHVNGLVLISGGWGINRDIISPQMRSALEVVDMATAALYHARAAPELGNNPATLRRAAEVWAREAYVPALSRSETLSDAQRSAIIGQLSRLTGLSKQQIDRKTLIITPRQFRTDLLKDEGKDLYVFDMRRTAAPEHPDVAALLRYFRNDLGYRTSLPYVGLEDVTQGFAPTRTYPESVNARWNYATVKMSPDQLKAPVEAASVRGDGPPHLGPPLPATEEAIAINPGLKVFVAAGMYDGFLPCAVGAETERQLPTNLRSSFTFHCYAGGHSMYLDDHARVELSRDVKEFIAGASTAKRN